VGSAICFSQTHYLVLHTFATKCVAALAVVNIQNHKLQYNIPVQEQNACTQNSIHDNVQIMKNGQCGSLCHSDKVKWRSWQHKMKLD